MEDPVKDTWVELHGLRDALGALLLTAAIKLLHEDTWAEIVLKAGAK